MSKIFKALRSPLIGTFCTALLLLPVKAVAGLVEYALILVLISVVVAGVGQLPPAGSTVVAQLEAAVEGAQAANMVDNRVAELSRLSKATGLTQALIGMTSDCSDCGELRDVLQQIIGQLALLETGLTGVSAACNPNGILVQPVEQCDPLANPTGCSTDPTAATYCSDECVCVPVISP